MLESAMGKPDITKREVHIINYLRSRPEGAKASEIYAEVSQELGDTISRPAYYKILDRLVAAEKVDLVEDGVRLYVIAPQLHATNRLTIDDVYALLPFYENTEMMARAVEAQNYFYSNRDTVLRQAALALENEPAADLFLRWITDLIKLLEADLASYFHVEEEGDETGRQVLVDPILERRIEQQVELLREILYRLLSVPKEVVDLPPWEQGARGLKQRPNAFYYSLSKLGQTLKSRVFGVGPAKTVIGRITVSQTQLAAAEQEMVISGSDGSFHAGSLGIHTARGFIEDESYIVTFNNSIAYIRSSERVRQQKGEKRFIHSAPLTRQTVDDPAYKGMVMAPFMFPMLTESEYEHMAKVASNVVQMRVDEAVFNNKAHDVATGELVISPQVHIRDGTVAPQERGYNHYRRPKGDPYGEFAREGIELTRNILQRIPTQPSRGKPRVFAGAVKSTQLKLFSHLISWYIAKGSRVSLGAAIDPDWSATHAHFISDVDVMTLLFAAVGTPELETEAWVSCIVVRQFPSLTDFYDLSPGNGEYPWYEFLKKMRRHAIENFEQYGGSLYYDAQLSEDGLADDSYLYLLENADYASFYIGHTGGQPAPKIPRYEFLCSLRELQKEPEKAAQVVEEQMFQVLTAILTSGVSIDQDHNFLSHLRISRIIPFVVYQAHELAKHLGKKLETEYKSMVIARLNRKVNESDVEIKPLGVRRYLERFSRAQKALPPGDSLYYRER